MAIDSELEAQLLQAVANEPEETNETAVATLPEPTETATETTTEETASPTGESVQEDTNTSLLKYIKDNFGDDLSGKYKDDVTALQGLVNASKLVGRRDEDAQIGRWMKENPREAVSYLQEQLGMTRQEAQQTQQAVAQNSGPPEYDPNWVHSLEFDESGRPVRVKEGESPDILSKYRKAQAYAVQQQQNLLFKPKETLGPLFEEYAKAAEERAYQRLMQEQGQQSEQAVANQIIHSIQGWAFVNGDPNQGYTAPGKVYQDEVQRWATKYPKMSGDDLHEHAMSVTRIKFAPQPAKAPVNKQVVKAPNVQKQVPAESTKRRDGESLIEMLTRVDKEHNIIKED